jgi:hypothetical protein
MWLLILFSCENWYAFHRRIVIDFKCSLSICLEYNMVFFVYTPTYYAWIYMLCDRKPWRWMIRIMMMNYPVAPLGTLFCPRAFLLFKGGLTCQCNRGICHLAPTGMPQLMERAKGGSFLARSTYCNLAAFMLPQMRLYSPPELALSL